MATKYPGFLTSEDKRRLTEFRREVFEGVAESRSQSVVYYEVSGNAEEAAAWGVAEPSFAEGVELAGIVELSPTEQNLTYWGNEELTRALVLLGKAEVDEAGVNINNLGRIEFVTDGVTEIFSINRVFRDRGMGHEPWTLILRCVPVKDAGDYP